MPILEFFFAILSNSIPSAISMLGGILLMAISGGAWGIKLDDKIKITLKTFGLVLLFFGGIWTSAIAIFQTFASYPNQLSFVWSFILKIYSFKNLTIFVLLALWIYCFRKYQILRLERGYEISICPVINKDPRSRDTIIEANILIENTGRGELKCAARLEKVRYRRLMDKRTREISVNELNPNGRYMLWKNVRPDDWITLRERIPNVLEVATDYNRHARFVFSANNDSRELAPGFYDISVRILRWKNRKWLDFREFNCRLTVHLARYDEPNSYFESESGGMEWLS